MANEIPMGSLKGPRGNGVQNPRVEADNLILEEVKNGIVETVDAGHVRGPKGLPGTNGVATDEAVAMNLEDPGAATFAAAERTIAAKTRSTTSEMGAALDARLGPARVSVGETNRTSELQEWVADLHAGRDRGSLRPGVYVAEGLVLPSLTTLSGAGGGMARFGANDDRAEGEKIDRLWGAVTIRRPSGSTSSAPMVHLKGPGASLRGVTLDANGSAATSLLSESFEGSILDVRMIAGAGIAWDVLKANNGLMRNILVDNHGSATLPAVRIRSVPGAGNAAHTNAQLIDLLTIERSVNTALQVGELGTATEAVEWLMLRNLHVEAPDDNSSAPGNAGPLIRLLNVKGVSFFDPLIYGGPGYLIEQDQDRTVALDPGGVRIVGGILIGQETDNASPFLVHLIRGDNFAALGAKFTRYNNHAFEVESTFGRRVWVDTARVDIEDQAILDRRTARSVYRTFGNAEIRGHVVSRGRVPTVVAGGGVAGLVSSDCDDSSGRIYFGTTGSPAAGGQFEVKFAEPFSGRAPVVTLTPATAAAAALRWHVTSTTAGFVARTDAPPPANLAAGAVGMSYSVVG